jgi:PIN domain nuclease of toxin-antitoxin system
VSKYLIDTHAILWWATSPHELSEQARLAMASGRNQLFVSYASLWEMAIKISQGKLNLPHPAEQLVQHARCRLLPIGMQHINLISTLPLLHRDPFDRMLVAQAKAEVLTVVTRDVEFEQYGVSILAA